MPTILPATGLLFAAVILAACAAAPNDPALAGAARPQTCEREYRVGSNIPVRECRDAITEEDRQRMVDEARRSARPTPSKNTGG